MAHRVNAHEGKLCETKKQPLMTAQADYTIFYRKNKGCLGCVALGYRLSVVSARVVDHVLLRVEKSYCNTS